MYRKELSLLSALCLLIFLLVAGTGTLVVQVVQRDASMLAIDTLPGLVNAGDAIALIDENWLRIHLLTQESNAPRQASLIQQIRSNSDEESCGNTAMPFLARKTAGRMRSC